MLNQVIEVGALQCGGMHGEEQGAGVLGELDEILPAIGVVGAMPHDGLDFILGGVAMETAHAVAFNEGHHVVFQVDEIVGGHIQFTIVAERQVYA